ncbi:hypothetical protein EMCRGX_G030359 [Ephydatia muelleri]
MEEDKRLGSFMDGFLQRQSCEELCNDDAHGTEADTGKFSGAVVAQALFMKDQTISASIAMQSKANAERRKKEVEKNRSLLRRIVDTIIFLGRQGLAFRGHNETSVDDSLNTGNFLEALKLLSCYDMTIQAHLSKVKENQRAMAAAQKGRRGRGSNLSNDTQNKIVLIISHLITETIVKALQECRAWALIVDTTADIAHQEQLSLCVRIVHSSGCVSEHILACQRALGTTAEDLFSIILTTLNSKDVSFGNLVAQTYDGASNMSGCYNGLQALI